MAVVYFFPLHQVCHLVMPRSTLGFTLGFFFVFFAFNSNFNLDITHLTFETVSQT